MRKINTYFMIVQSVFLLVMIGGGIFLFHMFGPLLYRNYRVSMAKEAFENLKDVDLGEINTDEALIL